MYLPEYSDKEDFHLLPDGTIVHTYEYGYERHELTCRRDDNWVVMQFTGLLDENGVEIYEGDIISYTVPGYESDDDPNIPHVPLDYVEPVEWQIDGFALDGIPLNVGLDFGGEVIGNIHQNPELLQS